MFVACFPWNKFTLSSQQRQIEIKVAMSFPFTKHSEYQKEFCQLNILILKTLLHRHSDWNTENPVIFVHWRQKSLEKYIIMHNVTLLINKIHLWYRYQNNDTCIAPKFAFISRLCRKTKLRYKIQCIAIMISILMLIDCSNILPSCLCNYVSWQVNSPWINLG